MGCKLWLPLPTSARAWRRPPGGRGQQAGGASVSGAEHGESRLRISTNHHMAKHQCSELRIILVTRGPHRQVVQQLGVWRDDDLGRRSEKDGGARGCCGDSRRPRRAVPVQLGAGGGENLGEGCGQENGGSESRAVRTAGVLAAAAHSTPRLGMQVATAPLPSRAGGMSSRMPHVRLSSPGSLALHSRSPPGAQGCVRMMALLRSGPYSRSRATPPSPTRAHSCV